MKHFNIIKLIILAFCLFYLKSEQNAQNYDSDYVETISELHNGELYKAVLMYRKDYRVRAKYFANELNNQTIYKRYESWKKYGGKKIVLYSAGAYMNNLSAAHATVVGLTIDDGEIVNKFLDPKMDGLVIVYPNNGGIAVSNIDNGDLTLSGGNAIAGKKYNLRNDYDLQKFRSWAVGETATVFQTHLLVFNNKLMFKTIPSCPTSKKRERRFLAICKDEYGEIVHVIIDKPEAECLYQASEKVLKYLHEIRGMHIYGMMNLDTGAQNVFKMYTKSGKEHSIIKGTVPLNNARNLLVYYFE